MKILHLISSLALGGAERQLSYLGPELVRLGHEVHVAFLSPGPNLQRLEANGVVLHQVQNGGNHDPRLVLNVLRVIRKIDPDIVQTWLLQMDIIGGLAKAITRKPWVLTERSCARGHPFGLKNFVRSRLGRKADAVVSNSRGGDRYWQTRVAPHKRVVVPNGVPFEEIEDTLPDSMSEFGIGASSKVILYVGRLLDGKNIPNLIMALARVMTDGAAVALFCGDGPLRPYAERLVGQLGISGRVHFAGNTQKVWSLMKRADLFAFVSEFEGFPNVVIEAMACGCPMVVSDIPAHREFLDGETAVFVDPRRPGEIAVALQRSLSIPDEAKRRARAAKEKAREWSTAAAAVRYEMVYRDVSGRMGIPAGGEGIGAG